MLTKRILSCTSRVAAVLRIGAAGLLRGLAHDADGLAHIERAVPREVGEEPSRGWSAGAPLLA